MVLVVLTTFKRRSNTVVTVVEISSAIQSSTILLLTVPRLRRKAKTASGREILGPMEAHATSTSHDETMVGEENVENSLTMTINGSENAAEAQDGTVATVMETADMTTARGARTVDEIEAKIAIGTAGETGVAIDTEGMIVTTVGDVIDQTFFLHKVLAQPHV